MVYGFSQNAVFAEPTDEMVVVKDIEMFRFKHLNQVIYIRVTLFLFQSLRTPPGSLYGPCVHWVSSSWQGASFTTCHILYQYSLHSTFLPFMNVPLDMHLIFPTVHELLARCSGSPSWRGLLRCSAGGSRFPKRSEFFFKSNFKLSNVKCQIFKLSNVKLSNVKLSVFFLLSGARTADEGDC